MTMTNALTNPNSEDDGFSGSLTSNRRGVYINWTDARRWRDRDDLTPPNPLLVGAVDEALQSWENKVPKLITAKPLPDPDELNSKIPVEQWPDGINGKDKPWKHVIIVLFADPATGALYKFVSPTTGAHIAFDLLKESTIT